MTGSSDTPPATRPGMAAQLGPRRHRRFTGPSGAVLFVCVFLPAVKACDSAVYPITVPWAWHPYLFGLVFALGAWAKTPRGVRRMILGLRWVAYTAAGGAALITALVVTDGNGHETLFTMGVWGGIAAALIAMIGVRGYSERRAAATAIVVGVGSAVWFGLWVADGSALMGAYVSLGAALGLVAGGLRWLGDIALDRPEPVPRAVARQPNRPVM
jgi:hypothetical protein